MNGAVMAKIFDCLWGVRYRLTKLVFWSADDAAKHFCHQVVQFLMCMKRDTFHILLSTIRRSVI